MKMIIMPWNESWRKEHFGEFQNGWSIYTKLSNLPAFLKDNSCCTHVIADNDPDTRMPVNAVYRAEVYKDTLIEVIAINGDMGVEDFKFGRYKSRDLSALYPIAKSVKDINPIKKDILKAFKITDMELCMMGIINNLTAAIRSSIDSREHLQNARTFYYDYNKID